MWGNTMKNSFFFRKIGEEQDVQSQDSRGNAYFVTFRLADAIPANDLNKLHVARQQWMAVHSKPYDDAEENAYERQFNQKIEDWLNGGYGGCILKRPECLSILVDAMCYFDQDQYMLDHWVIMPNHVHAIVIPQGKAKIENIVHNWKQFTSNEINRVTGFMGYHLWHYETIDRLVRDEQKLSEYRSYIISEAQMASGDAYLSTQKALVLV